MKTAAVSLEELEAAVRRVPAQQRKEVLLFIEFLEYLTANHQNEDDADDADLWNAVLAHQAYRSDHPEDEPELFDTPEAFLRATADL
ncbi:MAG TPA: hypothetical protein VF897_07240 [Roseiflexaceae bacterium]